MKKFSVITNAGRFKEGKNVNNMKNLGKHGKDIITGFEGTITSAHYYLTGCTQYGLTPKAKEDGSLGETMFFDENRVIISGDKVKLVPEIKEEEEAITNLLPQNQYRNKPHGCDTRERPN